MTAKTEHELVALLRERVAAAGGAKKWLKANKLFGWDASIHMITDGRAATLPEIRAALGYRAVTIYEPIEPAAPAKKGEL